jgi:hypothetical protein
MARFFLVTYFAAFKKEGKKGGEIKEIPKKIYDT